MRVVQNMTPKISNVSAIVVPLYSCPSRLPVFEALDLQIFAVL